MKIEKYQANGNDFLIVEKILSKKKIKNLCSRHFGIGGDGLILYNKEDNYVEFFNADGSKATLCGNGIRCLGLYLKKHYLANEFEVYLKKNIARIKVLKNDEIKIYLKTKNEDVYKIKKSHDNQFYLIDIGNNHAISIVDNLTNVKSKKWDNIIDGKAYNLNFVKIVDVNKIKVLTYEIGVGFTLSCGSGSLSSVIVLNRLNLIPKKVEVINEGGNVFINLDEYSLLGKAKFVFECEYDETI